MRIDAKNQLIKGKGYTLTFNETKSFMTRHFADVLKDYVVGHKGSWVVDWMGVFKFAEETKILNVILWQRQTSRN